MTALEASRAALIIAQVKASESPVPEPMKQAADPTVSAPPAVANQAVLTLSAMYLLAEGWGLVPEGINPCRSVMKYPGHRRERFFTEAEFEHLGCVLDTEEAKGGASAPAMAAVRLLVSLLRLPGIPWVIPSRKPGTHLGKHDDAWIAVHLRTGIKDVQLNDLRHSGVWLKVKCSFLKSI